MLNILHLMTTHCKTFNTRYITKCNARRHTLHYAIFTGFAPPVPPATLELLTALAFPTKNTRACPSTLPFLAALAFLTAHALSNAAESAARTVSRVLLAHFAPTVLAVAFVAAFSAATVTAVGLQVGAATQGHPPNLEFVHSKTPCCK